jgi:hypothetical protein
MSMSPTFHEQFFSTCSFRVKLFWQNYIGKKAAHKMLLKLTPEKEECSFFDLAEEAYTSSQVSGTHIYVNNRLQHSK